MMQIDSLPSFPEIELQSALERAVRRLGEDVVRALYAAELRRGVPRHEVIDGFLLACASASHEKERESAAREYHKSDEALKIIHRFDVGVSYKAGPGWEKRHQTSMSVDQEVALLEELDDLTRALPAKAGISVTNQGATGFWPSSKGKRLRGESACADWEKVKAYLAGVDEGTRAADLVLMVGIGRERVRKALLWGQSQRELETIGDVWARRYRLLKPY